MSKSGGNWKSTYGAFGWVYTTTQGDGIHNYGGGQWGGRATGWNYDAGLIYPQEIQAGVINHALAIIIPGQAATSGTYVWPARGTDGYSTSSNAIPLGSHIQLDPSIDVNTLSLSAGGKMIARALQVYGGWIGDTGDVVGVDVQEFLTADGTGINSAPWQGLLTANDLGGIPLNKLRVLQTNQSDYYVEGATSTPSRAPTNTPTRTPIPSNTPTRTLTNTPTNTSTSTPSNTPTRTPTSPNTPTRTLTNTSTSTPSNTPTRTPSYTPTRVPSNTPTRTPSNTPSYTPTRTLTNTSTSTPSNTPTRTPSYTPTRVPSNTPTRTPRRAPTNTPTRTPRRWPTRAPRNNTWQRPTATPTRTPSPTAASFAPALANNQAAVVQALPGGYQVIESNTVNGGAGWKLMTQPSGASGSSYLMNTNSATRLSLPFQGTSIGVAFLAGPSFGQFSIVVDGGTQRGVNTNAPNYQFGYVIVNGLSAGAHTVQIVPSAGVIGIDAFLVPVVAAPQSLAKQPPTSTTVPPTALPFPTVNIPVVSPPVNAVKPTEVVPLPLPANTSNTDNSQLPTALPFPTLNIPNAQPSTIATAQTVVPVSALPVTDNMDNGAQDWQVTGNWQLTSSAAYNGVGLGWRAAGGTPNILRWNRPIDLHSVSSASLSVQSMLISANPALVQISSDGTNWTSIGSIPASPQWQTASVDLSAYVGQVIQLQFMWVSPSPGDTWQLDNVTVSTLQPNLPTATLPAATQTVPTALSPEPTQAEPTASLPPPTVAPTNTSVPPPATPVPTNTSVPTDVPTRRHRHDSTPTPAPAATDTVQS
ncbi:MAG TPA: hypothetical protein VHD90_17315 [Phototrophicaceae bacterium]|nr:hypothetical protein [Phototrophicaceae bacterium]